MESTLSRTNNIYNAIDVIKSKLEAADQGKKQLDIKLQRRKTELETIKQKCKEKASNIGEIILALEQQTAEKERIKVELENIQAINGLYKLIADKLYSNYFKSLYNLSKASEAVSKVPALIEDARKGAKMDEKAVKRDEEPTKIDEDRVKKRNQLLKIENLALATSLRLKKFELLKEKIQATRGSFL